MRRPSFHSRAFSLVELLVVITILAIISVVAYMNFGTSIDKAKNGRRVSDLASIESALQKFYNDKNYYPMPSAYGADNLWGYSTNDAQICNTFTGSKNSSNEFNGVSFFGSGGGKVYSTAGAQIGAKGVIDTSVLSKDYLSQNLSDPGLSDIKVGDTKTFKDMGIGKYVYGVYAKGNADWSSASTKGSSYNLAITISDPQKGFVAKIIGNFDKNTCNDCPGSLVGSGGTAGVSIIDGSSSITGATNDPNELIPYGISGY